LGAYGAILSSPEESRLGICGTRCGNIDKTIAVDGGHRADLTSPVSVFVSRLNDAKGIYPEVLDPQAT